MAPVWMRSFLMLTFTISPMATRLTANASIFQTLLPIGIISSRATMHVTVTMRNIRSRRLMR